MKNRNAYIGMNNEQLIKNSIADHPTVIKKLQERFDISGSLENTAGGGVYGDRADVRINFKCGHYIDANVKSYKKVFGFNQLRRTSVSKFCEDFGLGSQDKNELENIIVEKSKNTRNPLFSEKQQVKWGEFFRKNAKNILKWGFSENPNREILVLYDRDDSIVKIYHMKDVLNRLSAEITFTKGGLNIGECVSFQRKGGDGDTKDIPKTVIQHPGNNVQLKVNIKKLLPLIKPVLLADYTI
ncbi:MAG: hypothetical protein FWB95_07520 [Treponema sp.]|nr:hypothetical protein [Treponema sp.]